MAHMDAASLVVFQRGADDKMTGDIFPLVVLSIILFRVRIIQETRHLRLEGMGLPVKAARIILTWPQRLADQDPLVPELEQVGDLPACRVGGIRDVDKFPVDQVIGCVCIEIPP
jgi:hypothetical protein